MKCFSFQESPDGLFVCMERFLGFGRAHVESYSGRTGNKLFVRIRRTKVPVPDDQMEVEAKETEGVPEKVSKMAIGVPGGFALDQKKKFTYEDAYDIVTLPEFQSWPIGKKEGMILFCPLGWLQSFFITQTARTFLWPSSSALKPSSRRNQH